MKKSVFVFLALALACALPAFAEGTRTWRQASFDDFEHGTAKGIAIRSDGDLVLAPSFKSVYTSPSTYIWSIASDGEGNAYAAAGSPARIYRIAPDGQATVIFEPKELQVQALVVDTSGVLYAATSPDGKVYKIERPKPPQPEKGKKTKKSEEEEAAPAPPPGTFTSSVFFDPKTKYIWDLALDAHGQLYVATGDRGEVYRVNRNGEGTLFFKSDEAHIRVLSFDTRGNLIAGSDGSGLIYRVAPNGEAFVLYSAPKKEITALAIDQAGNIYASAVGEKRSGATGSSNSSYTPPPQTSTPPPSSGSSAGGNAPSSSPSTPSFTVSAGSDIYKIAPDGSPKRIWNSRDDIVYALGFDERGHLLAGTGNKGKIFAVEGESEYTDLLKASANQITAMAKAPNGGLWVSTSNLGKVFLLGAAPDADGSYESDVFDAHNFSRWGRMEVRGRGAYEFYERSGNVDNPDRNWSPWKKVELATNAEADVPSARFIQWRAVLHSGTTPAAIQSVTLNYRPSNVAPVVDDVAVQVGTRYQSTPKSSDSGTSNQRFDSPPPPIHDRDSIGVRWIAHDDNDDTLSYSIYYRGDNETGWKLLKDKVTDKFYSWDAALFPDGGYVIRIVASDAPSHSPDEALTDYADSERFEVDNTPPSVRDLNATVESGEFHITFRASDNYSPIKRAEYSIDAGAWQFVEPVGLISDNRVENYDFSVPTDGVASVAAAEPGIARGKKAKNLATSQAPVEHVVVVRVYDRFDNMGSAKVIIHVPR